MSFPDHPSSTRKLAAIFAADIAGYSALISADEDGTVHKLKRVREAVLPIIEKFGGRVIDLAGDGILAEFGSAVRAVEAAVSVQNAMATLNSETAPNMQFRIGINLGDVIHDGERLYGDGINIAARLENIASPGGICISGKVHDEVSGRVMAVFQDLGEHSVKNIPRPIRVYSVDLAGSVLGEANDRVQERVQMPSLDRGSPSIAVLPFHNATGDPAQDYLAEGIVDEISTALSRIRWLFVIGAASAAKYGGRSPDLNAIKQALRVGYVLQGSVRRSNDRMRIAAQLLEVPSGRQLWADRFEGPENEVFELQDQVAMRVISAIEPNVHLSETAKSRQKAPANESAYDHFLRAIPLLRVLSSETYQEAERHLRAAIKIDPNYSIALAFLADCLGRQAVFGGRPYEIATREAAELAHRATIADPEDGTSFAAAAWISFLIGRHDAALEAAKKALQLHPNSAYVQSQCGHAYLGVAETDAARSCFERALEFNPIDPRRYFAFQGTGMAYFFDRNFEEALIWLDRAKEEAPFARVHWRFRASALAHLGRWGEATDAVKALHGLQSPQTLQQIESRAQCYRHAWMRELYLDGLRKAGYDRGEAAAS